jgi:hypothetical protein
MVLVALVVRTSGVSEAENLASMAGFISLWQCNIDMLLSSGCDVGSKAGESTRLHSRLT